ncbi:Hint domain-containing protein [Thalassobius vesicularis]|uniref:Hint domain-containing protein n=1 Tax=Thalassobius vesicularis TaxID=1294297 RepID=A0A4S3M5R5_9RHOB|nr:Hint domain-containing protein [Thalassobius vesicularis]THD72087.1 Hint domain-containing protein [Thalassobius vesicularis]
MGTGYSGTFVISWSQTELDGLRAASVSQLAVGAMWTWHGEALRVDGRNDLLRLENADGEETLRKSAARMVARLVGMAMSDKRDQPADARPLRDRYFIVTDGKRSYTVTLIDPDTGGAPLAMFVGEAPPQRRELWIVHTALRPDDGAEVFDTRRGVICFTPGTRIDTPDGPRLVEDLREGDKVQTEDSGAQEVQWVGQRRMTGARLYTMPYLRPIRIRAGAFGFDRPDQELLVSPDHRMLLKGAAARALFNTPEVLVAARDLVNGHTVNVDLGLREVTYIHLLLPDHHVIRANGLETESFHPASAHFDALEDSDRMRLQSVRPDVAGDPATYGDYARRTLSRSEAAILMHELA